VGSFLRQFTSSLQTPGQPSKGANVTSSPSSNNQGQTGAGPQPAGAGNTPVQADKWCEVDNAGLGIEDPVWVRDRGGRDANPVKPEIDYYFGVKVINTGIDHSGSFLVRFNLTQLNGADNWQQDYTVPNGLKAGGFLMASVFYGAFPVDAVDTAWELSARVFSTCNSPRGEPLTPPLSLFFSVQGDS